jgi:predicted nucleic acid-binding protein
LIASLLLAVAVLIVSPPPPAAASGGGPAPAGTATTLEIPEGRHVLPDGEFEPGEWDDAAVLPLDGVELLAKGDARYLYLALRFVEEKHSGLDLYLAAGPEVRRLFHISSELLWKEFAEGTWSEYHRDVRGWTGNPVGFLHEGERVEIHEPDGFELQLARSMLAAQGLGADRLRLAFRLKRPELTVPAGAEAAALEDWLLLTWASSTRPPEDGPDLAEAVALQALRIRETDAKLRSSALGLMERYGDLRLSYADCIGAAVAQEIDAGAVFGLDHDFRVMGFAVEP